MQREAEFILNMNQNLGIITMIGSSIARQQHSLSSLSDTIKNYFQLTKPRIIPLLLITTAASMAIASAGKIDPVLLLVTLIGGTLAAASAQVMNCIYDRDIDYDMLRTRKRPLPSGSIQPHHALIFAIILGILAETSHYPKYRYWWRSRSDPAFSWLGCGDGRFKSYSLAIVYLDFLMDSPSFLVISFDD
jgi:hypothetical protein